MYKEFPIFTASQEIFDLYIYMKLTDSTKGLHVSVYLKFQTSETLLISVTGSQSQNHIWGAKNAETSFFLIFFFI